VVAEQPLLQAELLTNQAQAEQVMEMPVEQVQDRAEAMVSQLAAVEQEAPAAMVQLLLELAELPVTEQVTFLLGV
jgi:hypothetical protein